MLTTQVLLPNGSSQPIAPVREEPQTSMLPIIILSLVISFIGQQPPAIRNKTMMNCEVQERNFSNLERIPLTVKLRSEEFEVDSSLINPKTRPATGTPYLKISVQALSQPSRSVPIKIVPTGRGRDLEESWLNLQLEIPIDDAERDQKIASYIENMRIRERSNGGDPRLKKLLENKAVRESMAATYRNIYLHNRVGTFGIACEFFPNSEKRPGNVPIQARGTKVKVEFKGDFLDQPNFH